MKTCQQARSFVVAAWVVATLATPTAHAVVVTWEVDRTNSYIRLTIPDQTIYVPDLGNVTMRIRDANNDSQWTDAGGRRAALAGQLRTEYEDGVSIRFLSGSHNLYALETTNLRPNPADWNPLTTNYTGTSTAPAALGGRVRATYVFIILPVTVDVAFMAMRNLRLDIANLSAHPIPVTNSAFAADTTVCGIAEGVADVDGLEISGFGQPVPDLYHEPLDPVVQTNAAGGVIANLGGRNRRLTYTINIPNFALDLSGTIVTGAVNGVIVANTELPEPPVLLPTLSIRKISESLFVLSWPTNAVGFLLERATSLTAADWSPTSPSPVIVGDQYVVTNTMTQPAGFYRLRKP